MAGSNWERVYKMAFASVYPQYVRKVEKKGRTKAELDEVICWLTGYSQEGLEAEIGQATDFETFFAKAPRLNPAREEIKGLICGQRVEDIQEPLTREIRYLDKLVDELAKGKAMGKGAALEHRAPPPTRSVAEAARRDAIWPAGGSAKPNPFDVTNLLRDGYSASFLVCLLSTQSGQNLSYQQPVRASGATPELGSVFDVPGPLP